MNMGLEQDKASKFMEFFENARKPAAILDVKGIVIKLNDEFHEDFRKVLAVISVLGKWKILKTCRMKNRFICGTRNWS